MIPKKEGIVIIQYKGKDYSGFYHVEANMIKVISKYGDKTTQLRSAPQMYQPEYCCMKLSGRN